jgi:hypothetical protein
MDCDVDISRALDTISEEIIGNTTKVDNILEIQTLTEGDTLNNVEMLTVKAALDFWIEENELSTKLFKIARMTIKYGDCFFLKPKQFGGKWRFIHPKTISAAIISTSTDDETVYRPVAWLQTLEDQNKKTASGGYVPTDKKKNERIIQEEDIIRFTLNDDMADTAPFGESILRPIYRTFKQKELLEDAVIIYRIQRAPERRVFYIDVGNMPPHRRKQYLESIKNEISQKKVPTFNGGQSEIDSVYNPHSMSEDIFLGTNTEGKGTKVETLSGGTSTGEVGDLAFFEEKLWRGLRIPVSYMKQGTDGATFNDGKVGVAYIQELRFALFIQRLQRHFEAVLDKEFKAYIRNSGIHIDTTTFKVILPEPSNFGVYRQHELDSTLLGSFGDVNGMSYVSKRYALKRYLNWSDEEIATNEQMLREERGMDPDKESTQDDLRKIYQSDANQDMLGGGGSMMGGGGDLMGGSMPPPTGGDLGGGDLLGGSEGEPTGGEDMMSNIGGEPAAAEPAGGDVPAPEITM